MKIATILALLAVAASTSVHAVVNLQAFPPADAGMTRFVINLPKEKDEAAFKVELLACASRQPLEQRSMTTPPCHAN